MAVKPIPDGYHTVTPYIVCDGADKVIEFVESAFGASVKECMRRPDGRVAHAEVRIGDSMVMLGDAPPGRPPSPGMLYVYVPDTDTTYAKAIAAGGKSIMAPATQFYGDRNAGVTDPCGNQWWIGTHVEDVPPAEMERRSKEHNAKGGGCETS
jgi:uncharacterized glyoxalase superfamily protein PhnB